MNWLYDAAPYFLTVYMLIGFSLFFFLRAQPSMKKDPEPAFEIVLMWICMLWMVTIPYSFWYAGKHAQQSLGREDTHPD